jgi:hypothetical protein
MKKLIFNKSSLYNMVIYGSFNNYVVTDNNSLLIRDNTGRNNNLLLPIISASISFITATIINKTKYTVIISFYPRIERLLTINKNIKPYEETDVSLLVGESYDIIASIYNESSISYLLKILIPTPGIETNVKNTNNSEIIISNKNITIEIHYNKQ